MSTIVPPSVVPHAARTAFAVLALVTLLLAPVHAAEAAPADATRYVYDANGRLAAVTASSAGTMQTAVHRWDPVGNLLSVTRGSADLLRVIDVSPGRGAPGETAIIAGTGFSAAASGNTVRFGGVQAAVTTASPTRLAVTVPAGAVSGSVTVATSAGTASSSDPFTVTGSAAMRIDDLTPRISATGGEVTLSGHALPVRRSESGVKVNGVHAEVLSTSATAVRFKVPEATGSGRVAVTGPDGSVTGPDLFISPTGQATDVADTGRLELDVPQTLSLGTSGKAGLFVFEAAAGREVSISIANSTIGDATLRLFRPDGTEQELGAHPANGYYGFGIYSGDNFVEPFTPPVSGTYSLLVDPTGSTSGSLRMTLNEVQPIDSTITPSAAGATAVVPIAKPGQRARIAVDARAGQRFTVVAADSTFQWVSLGWKTPGGEWLGGSTGFGPGGNMLEGATNPSDGRYTLEVDPNQHYTGSVRLTFYDATDVTRAVEPSSQGATEDVATTVPGQNIRLTFQGRTGQEIMWQTLDSTMRGGIRLVRPDGSEHTFGLSGLQLYQGTNENGPYKLTMDGTHTLLIDPMELQTGSLRVKVWDVPPPAQHTASPSRAGHAVDVATTAPGQVAHIKVSAQAGQRILVRATGSTFPQASMTWRTSTGAALVGSGSLNNDGSADLLDTPPMPADGEYTLVIDPNRLDTGSATLTFYDSTDVTGTLDPTPQGDVEDVVLSAAGQNARLTFTGRAGQEITWQTVDSTVSGALRMFNPDGSERTFGLSGLSLYTGSNFYGPYTLPAAGTYTFVLDPHDMQTGTLKFKVWDVPPPDTHTAVPTAAGAPVTISVGTPGQRAQVKVDGRAEQRVLVKATGSTIPWASMRWRRPDGTTITPTGIINNDATADVLDTAPLPADGEYTLEVDPNQLDTGQATLTFYDTSDVIRNVTPTPEGVRSDFEIATPGQNAMIRFTGRTGQQIAWQTIDSTMRGGIRLFKPDGSEQSFGFSGLSLYQGENWYEPYRLTADGTYTLMIDPYDTQTGTFAVKMWDVPPPETRTVAGTRAGDSTTVALGTPGQIAHIRVAATAGQRLAVRASGSTFSWAAMGWQNPDGSNLGGTTSMNADSTPDFYDGVTVPSDGTYTLEVNPDKMVTGQATLTVYDATDVTETVTPSVEGDGRDLAFTTPGQNGRVRFAGVTGQQVTIALTGSTVANGRLQLFKPDGTEVYLGYWGMSFGTGDTTHTLPSLPVDGTYTLLVDPRDMHTGALRLTAKLPASGGGTMGAIQLVSLAANAGRSVLGGKQHARRTRVPGGMPRFRTLRDYELLRPVGGVPGARPPQSTRRAAGPPIRYYGSLRRYRRGATGRPPVEPGARHRRRGSSIPRVGSLDRYLRARVVERDKPAPKANAARRPAARLPRAAQPVPPRIATRQRADDPAAWLPTRRDRGTDWESRRGPSPWAQLPPLGAEPGVTAVAGQTLKLNGQPLRNVAVSIDRSGVAGRTDATGRFLLRNVPRGKHVLLVNGTDVREPGEEYGIYEIRVEVRAGQTTAVPDTIWMAALDPAGDLRIPKRTTKPLVLKNPRIPGFEIRIPAGSTITGIDGKPVRKLNLTAVPTDRPPYRLPVTVSSFFTAQPGGAYLSKGAQVVYPNYSRMAPGQRTDFWNYDPDDRGWYVYGKGSVTADGQQSIPDEGVRIWEFTAAMRTDGAGAPVRGPNASDGASDGDPVDLGTGLFVYEKTDLALPGALPLELTRTYRPDDTFDYPFGRGTTTPWDMRLTSIVDYRTTDLVLPHGGVVRFERTSPGDGLDDAVLEPTRAAGRFTGSKLVYNDEVYQWDLHVRDGTVYEFPFYTPLGGIRDPEGNWLRVTRRCVICSPSQVTTSNGRWIRFTLDANNRIVRAEDNGGRATTYSYDANSRLATSVDANGGTTMYRYDITGRMTSIIDPKNVTWLQNVYDANGRVTEQTLANGGKYRFVYEVEGSRVARATVTDPRGTVREVTFDANALPVRDVRAKGTLDEQVHTYERDSASGSVVAEVDPLLRRTTYTHDARGNVTSVTRLAGTADAVTRTTGYGTSGLVTSETDELGSTTRYEHDVRGRLTKVTDPTNRETTYAYLRDGGADVTEITDAAGHKTRLTYVDGNLVASKDPLGRTTRNYVDVAGRVTATRDPLGHTTLLEVDDGNLLRRATDPRGGVSTFAYDVNGNLTGVTDARGNAVSATYDAMDRLSTWSDGLGRIHRAERDLDGNVVKVTDRKGQITTKRYDALGRLVFVGFGTAGTATSPTYASTITYTYDKADRLVKAVDSVDGTVTWEYDALDRRTKETSARGTVTYGYDKAGRRTSLTVTGQPAVAYGYDAAGRLTSVTQGTNDVRVGRDVAGRRAEVTLPNGVVQRSTYDAASQLTALRYERNGAAVGDVNYEYDDAGRRTAAWGSLVTTVLPAPMTGATYDAANRRTRHDAATYTYDLNGNLLSDGTRTYTWNKRDQLASVSVGSTTTSLAYDALGRRSSRTIGKNPITRFLSDDWNVAHELNATSITGTMLSGPGLDDSFAQTTGGVTKALLTDALGSVVATADAAGTVAKTGYGPFGETADASARSKGYTGREHDGNGLVFLRGRYYSPELKRFISEDPLGLEGGDLNLYAYVRNDPVQLVDRLGLAPMAGDGGCMSPPTPGRKSGGAAPIGSPSFLSSCIHQAVTPKQKDRVERRDGGLCWYCKEPTAPSQRSERGVTPNPRSRETDHWIPKSAGGTDEDENLRNSCRACNRHKWTTPGAEYEERFPNGSLDKDP